MKVRCLLVASALAGLLAISATGATAAVVFDFGVGPNGVVTPSWAGNQGVTDTYTISGQSLTATAFGPNSDQLFGKNGGGDENGLGMTNDPSGENEIYFGKGFIQLDVSLLTGALQLAFNSTTAGEQWTVYGSNSAGVLGSATLPGSIFLIGSGTTETTQNLTGGYKYYDVLSTVAAGGDNGGNVLIKSLTVSVPEPASWGLMIVGVLGIGAVLRQRRRNALSAA